MVKKRHIQSDLMITLKNDFQSDENKVDFSQMLIFWTYGQKEEI